MCTDFWGKVYSVGDGFCYEGIINNSSSRRFHFIVDCGSQAPQKTKQRVGELSTQYECNDRLKEIAREIVKNHNHIDLFILTHLHKDHYNGMKFLFSKGIVNTVIMPYLYPAERLYLIMNSDMEEDIEFLASPYDTTLRLVKENNPNAKLILIRGNNYDEEKENTLRPNESVSWGVDHEDVDSILETEGLESSDVKVVRANARGIIIPNYIWMFKLFNLEADKDDVNMLKKIAGDLTAANLYSKIKNKHELSKLRKQYRIIANVLLKDLNNTSIVIYHAPFEVCDKYGTLITGDIDLNHGFVNDILNYFNNDLKYVGLFSIPHHGSDKNWNKDLIKNGDLDDVVCFASTHNYYTNRLDGIMMSDLRVHNICALVVDENRFSEFVQLIRSWKDDGDHIIRKNRDKIIEIIV